MSGLFPLPSERTTDVLPVGSEGGKGPGDGGISGLIYTYFNM